MFYGHLFQMFLIILVEFYLLNLSGPVDHCVLPHDEQSPVLLHQVNGGHLFLKILLRLVGLVDQYLDIKLQLFRSEKKKPVAIWTVFLLPKTPSMMVPEIWRILMLRSVSKSMTSQWRSGGSSRFCCMTSVPFIHYLLEETQGRDTSGASCRSTSSTSPSAPRSVTWWGWQMATAWL